MKRDIIELKLSQIKCESILNYAETDRNCGEYTVRYIIHNKNGFVDNKIHISKNKVPTAMISLYCEELNMILNSIGINLRIDL